MGCYCDYDMPRFFNREVRKARKAHRCCECGGRVQPGEAYEYVSGMWDDYLQSFKTCDRCVNFRKWMTNNLPCFCWAYEGLFETAAEAVEDAEWRAGAEVKGLRFAMNRRIVQIKRHNAAVKAAA